jgi:hypothetical protein
MEGLLKVLGYLCLIGVAIALLFLFMGEPDLMPFVPGLFILGTILLALSTILERLTRVEALLLGVSPETPRIATDLGDFEKPGDVEGKARCLGCRRMAPKAELYYSQSLDVYYHPECLTRDRGR